MPASRLPWFTSGDLDGFFGLFLDNVIQLLLITVLCQQVVGLPRELVWSRILPGAAVSIVLGNLFYSWQARRLARREGRDDVTALPYGINTVSLFAFVLLIMKPIAQQTHDPLLAWRAGLVACFVSALIEISGAFVGGWLRRLTPRAGLLSSLAGIAMTFIAMDFVLRSFEQPLVAILPLGIILAQYMSRIRLPFRLPAGLVAIVAGTAMAHLFAQHAASMTAHSAWGFGLVWPQGAVKELLLALKPEYLLAYLSVTIPVGLGNALGSLQNIESAEAAGDRYAVRSSLLVNGLGSLVACGLGSCFPTTIYIGHPGWKALGARSGYSLLSGAAITVLCLTGTVGWVFRTIPLEAGMGILLWVGIAITAQAFQETPKPHALAVAVGLFPAIAAWGLMVLDQGLQGVGSSLFALAQQPHVGFALTGLISLERGFLFTSMILAAISVWLIERQFLRAAGWALVAAALSAVGLIHAYHLSPAGITSPFALNLGSPFAISYTLCGLCFLGLHGWHHRQGA